MKQKILIGSIIGLLIISFYIWSTVFNMVNESTINKLVSSFSSNNADQIDEHGWNPLMHASWEGDLEKASLLIDEGANVNMADKSGYTPLHLAVQEGHFSLVKLLIESGALASLNKLTSDNESPLYLAAENGYTYIFSYLIDSGAQLDYAEKNNINGYTMLHAAVSKGKFDMVKHLLDLGFDPNAKDTDGQTPLMLIYGFLDTTSEDLIKMINILVNGGAEVNVIDSRGVSPLLLAYYEGKKEVIEHLIKLGATGVIETKTDAQEALKLLEIDSVDKYKQAIAFGNLGAVKLFLKAGYDPNIRDETAGSTMLFQLVFPEDLKMMELLLKNGANPNIKNDMEGVTPLWMAVSQNKPAVVELLLKYGAENIENNAGWTPLMVAKDDNNMEFVNLLEQYLSENTYSNITENDIFQNDSELGTDFYYGSPFITDESTSPTDSDSQNFEDFPEFEVNQNGKTLNRFYTAEEAIEFAKNYENIEVRFPNSTIWDNIPSYVYQNDQLIGNYDTKVEALEVAGSLENAKVVNLSTGKVMWDSYPRECRTCESAIQDQY